jgi:hypothetical protein
MDIPHNSYNPFSPARLWYVKEIRVDTDGPLLSFASTKGCCGAARRTGLSCILQHFCWLKRRPVETAGQTGLLQVHLLLTQHLLAVAAIIV